MATRGNFRQTHRIRIPLHAFVSALTAAGAPSGQAFAFWTGDTGVLASATSLTTTATLSQPYVSLRAIYKLNTAPSGLTVTPGAARNAF
jgi:hypothetical protein